jgi:putative IMPACT (imprinted ancient) family translation regulator
MNVPSISNLDSFIHHTRPQPKPIATSPEIRDRGSTFVANIYKATTPSSAQLAIQHLKNVEHHAKPASHEISAWRCMVLKDGRSGLEGTDDFEVKSGSDDDGEEWAAAKVLRVMVNEGVIDAAVIVSRW